MTAAGDGRAPPSAHGRESPPGGTPVAAAVAAEAAAVRERYARRAAADRRYRRLDPAVLWPAQERERAVARLLVGHGWQDGLEARHAVEVGSGGGGNLLELIRLGFAPEGLTGIELLAERHAEARRRLPAAVRLDCADATAAGLPAASQDLVLQFTVFSSLLDDAVQHRLAEAMWRWTKPGGAVLWYDFVFDNPANPDVRGVPLARVRELFPESRVEAHRLTLAPPLARAVCRLHPALYTAFNLLPMLRTHVLCWIAKPLPAT